MSDDKLREKVDAILMQYDVDTYDRHDTPERTGQRLILTNALRSSIESFGLEVRKEALEECREILHKFGPPINTDYKMSVIELLNFMDEKIHQLAENERTEKQNIVRGQSLETLSEKYDLLKAENTRFRKALENIENMRKVNMVLDRESMMLIALEALNPTKEK